MVAQMTVYVDDMRAKYGSMVMCHMIADTEAELHAMAARIGVAGKWYQRDHYDIALSKRALAVAAGAQEITWRDCLLMSVHRRRNPSAPLVTPAEGHAWLMERVARRKADRVIAGSKGDEDG
jgi:hypothetical protein